MLVGREYCCSLDVCIIVGWSCVFLLVGLFIVVGWPCLLLLVGRVYCCWLACVFFWLAVCILLVGRVNCCWLEVSIVVCLSGVLLLVDLSIVVCWPCVIVAG